MDLGEPTAGVPIDPRHVGDWAGPPHGLLDGRIVLVTAAAGTGIGFATARRCAEERAIVAISDRHERRLAESADAIAEATGRRPLAVPCDVTDQAQIDALMDAVAGEFGRIDVLVNNAGLGSSAAVQDMTDDEWDTVQAVTLTATFKATRSVLRYMIPAQRGIIVNNASVVGWRAQAAQAHYAAAKAGVMALTRSTAMDVAAHGIRVNAVATSIAMHPYLARSAPAELLAQLSAQEAFGRAAHPWEIANVMVFLASDYSSYMTGEIVSVSCQHP